MTQLHDYARRRNFERTPEPGPRAERRATKGPLRFVVQGHAARAMHYDFRLQVGDVLVSWAIPKGPSLNPKDRRLAVMTEDHPLDYARFEGVIPKGQYGGGSVIVWDEGTWEPEGDAQESLKKGKLTFTLHGTKLSGRFHLTRTRARTKRGGEKDGTSWLLIKGRDDAAREGAESIVEASPRSVLSGRTLQEVAVSPDAVWRSQKGEEKLRPRPRLTSSGALPGAVKAPFPEVRRPQLATLVRQPPGGDDFLHEAKLDGYRLLAAVRGKTVELWTRGDKEWAERFPSIAEELATLGIRDALLDGELVALDEKGVSNFQLLQNAVSSKRRAELIYIVFDLPYLNGHDWSTVPLLKRKAALSDLLRSRGGRAPHVRFSEHIIGHGPEFFAEACQLGLEGIVSKRVDAPYRGERTQAWLKCKCLKRQEVVIGGYTDPSGSRSGLGALLVGVHDEQGQLRFAGKVGTGFTERSLRDLYGRLSKMVQETAPFARPPRGAEARGVHWVRPELLAEVSFSEVTEGGKLRHPSFQGLREDKSAAHVPLERPVEVTEAEPKKSEARPGPLVAAGKTQSALLLPSELSHPERVLYPGQGLTKQELAEYYVRVADWILPYVSERLLTLVRCPAGEGKPCFYQKHSKQGLPESIIAQRVAGETEPFVFVRDAAGLVGLVQLGVLEIHTWGSRIGRLECPDQLIFDLDPDPDLEWARVALGALDVRDELEKLGLRSFVKTTGGKGLHVVAPIEPRLGWPDVKAFCKAVAEAMVRAQPSRYVATMTKEKRKGKIFVDYLRNAREATAVAPYSTRSRPGAPVSTPVAWEELTRDLRNEFPLRRVLERLEKLESDPWSDFLELKQSITKKAMKTLELA